MSNQSTGATVRRAVTVDAMREQVDSAGGWGLLLDRYAAVLLPSLEATPGSSA